MLTVRRFVLYGMAYLNLYGDELEHVDRAGRRYVRQVAPAAAYGTRGHARRSRQVERLQGGQTRHVVHLHL